MGHEWEEDDQILMCDGCNVAVHEQCYNIPKTCKENTFWYCDVCHEIGKNKSSKIKCALCPFKGGAYKKAVNGKWVHGDALNSNKTHTHTLTHIHIHIRTFKHTGICFSWVHGTEDRSDRGIGTPRAWNIANVDQTRKPLKCQICKVCMHSS
jgi:hypothetical protein